MRHNDVVIIIAFIGSEWVGQIIEEVLVWKYFFGFENETTVRVVVDVTTEGYCNNLTTKTPAVDARTALFSRFFDQLTKLIEPWMRITITTIEL